jgi:hypothetical protein
MQAHLQLLTRKHGTWLCGAHTQPILTLPNCCPHCQLPIWAQGWVCFWVSHLQESSNQG